MKPLMEDEALGEDQQIQIRRAVREETLCSDRC